jgi:hypothetical protein
MANNETQHLTDEAVAERQAAEDRVLAHYQAEAERQRASRPRGVGQLRGTRGRPGLRNET